jgi:hypothetical protein
MGEYKDPCKIMTHHMSSNDVENENLINVI